MSTIIKTPFFKFLGFNFINRKYKDGIVTMSVRYENGVIATYKLDNNAWDLVKGKQSVFDESGLTLVKEGVKLNQYYRAAIHNKSKRVIALQRNINFKGERL